MTRQGDVSLTSDDVSVASLVVEQTVGENEGRHGIGLALKLIDSDRFTERTDA